MKHVAHKFRLSVLERFVLVVGLLVLSLVVTSIFPALLLTILLFVLLKIKGVAWRDLLRFLRIPLVFACVGLLSIVLVLGTNEPNTILVISRKLIPLSITIESLQKGEEVLWRTLNSLLSLYLFIGTTSVKEKSALATKLHIPNSLIELSVLSFRYIQLLSRKKDEIRMAQELRLGYSSYVKSFRSLVLLLSAVFIYSISTFQLNYQALLTRGYHGTLYYGDYEDVPRERWWVLTLLIIIFVVLLIAYQIVVRWIQ